MTYEEQRVVTRTDETVATQPPSPDPAAPAPPYATASGTTITQERIVRSGSTNALIERILVFVFGLVQLILVIRVILLLLNAREGNDLVSLVYNISDPFVGPFRGILGREAVSRGGTYFDGAALLALVGWTVLELVIIALLRVFRRGA